MKTKHTFSLRSEYADRAWTYVLQIVSSESQWTIDRFTASE